MITPFDATLALTSVVAQELFTQHEALVHQLKRNYGYLYSHSHHDLQPSCNLVEDRDVNASINIRNFALADALGLRAV